MAKTLHNRTKKARNRPSRKKPLEQVKDVIRIKPAVFKRLKENEDFVALVRIGRLVNALNFSYNLVGIQGEGSEHRRNFHRSVVNAAGYIFEGLQLIDSLVLRHVNETYYEPLNQIRSHPNAKRRKQIVEQMRHGAAFHMDQDNKVTKAALSELTLKFYDLSTSIDPINDPMSACIHLSDTVDINYVIDRLKKPGQTLADEPEIMREIEAAIGETLINMSASCQVFIVGIARKLKLI